MVVEVSMKQVILALFTSIVFLFATQNATAGIITINFDAPISDDSMDFSVPTTFNLDNDLPGFEIRLTHTDGLAPVLPSELGQLYLMASGSVGTTFHANFLNPVNGDVTVDSSLAMTSLSRAAFIMQMDIGINYLGVQGLSSCLTCYGFLQIDFDGQDALFTHFVYESVAGQALVTSVPVPEPGSIVLLGFALIGLAYTKKKRA